jgi:hypothetical protein
MTPTRPSEDAIRRRAHEIWQRRGKAPGTAVDDWLRAERELTAEAATGAAKAAAPLPPKPPVPTAKASPSAAALPPSPPATPKGNGKKKKR